MGFAEAAEEGNEEVKAHCETVALAGATKNGLTTHVEKAAPEAPTGRVVITVNFDDGRRGLVVMSEEEALTLGVSLLSCAALACNRLPTVVVPTAAARSLLHRQ